MGWCRRRVSEAFTSTSFARIRFEIALRLTQKRPSFPLPTEVGTMPTIPPYQSLAVT
jgi:hypothetical protein